MKGIQKTVFILRDKAGHTPERNHGSVSDKHPHHGDLIAPAPYHPAMKNLIPTLSLLAIAPLALVACSEQGATETGEKSTQADPHDTATAAHEHAEEAAHAGETAKPAEANPAGQTIEVAGFTFTAPQGWNPKPPSNQMRLAEINVPGPTDDPSAVCIAVFSTAGGDVEANISRWIGQFTNPAGGPVTASQETKTVSGHSTHLVEISGDYHGMGMAPPQGGTMMRAAIIEQDGPMHLFIKMTGPKDRMESLADGWNALIDSMHTP